MAICYSKVIANRTLDFIQGLNLGVCFDISLFEPAMERNFNNKFRFQTTTREGNIET